MFYTAQRARRVLLVAFVALAALAAECLPPSLLIVLAPGPDLEFRAQEAMVTAQPGTTIVFPAGTYEIRSEMIVATSHITLRGQGMNATVLDFTNQEHGAQGILGTADVFTVEDIGIRNTPGDGIKVEGANHVTFRRVRVEWTGGPSETNGAYGLYPVQCRNILVEDSVVIGASDAGIYVGQSEQIVVRRNVVEYNVAGIEIENSKLADVYENTARHNTGGILVFDLPNLSVQGGQRTRVFDNLIYENNTPNFAPEGNIVGVVPGGTGLMIMANDDIEAFDNFITNNRTVGVAIISYLVTGNTITDPEYDPIPQRINLHDNVIWKANAFSTDDGEFSFLLNLLFLLSPIGEIADVVYDGILSDDGSVEELPEGERICIRGNEKIFGNPSTFGNLHLAPTELGIPLPTEPLSFDLAPHDCTYDPLPPVVLETPPPPPPPSNEGPIEELILCNLTPGTGPNFAAVDVVCPNLADYRLFDDPTDPTRDPNGGIPFDLTTPLFSDYASKYRFLFLPPGTQATYDDDGTFAFPVGTIIAKTFSFVDDLANPTSERVVETRLLMHRADGWVGIAYIWDEAMTMASRAYGGGATSVTIRDFGGLERTYNYQIPNANQCLSCHSGQTGAGAGPIGPKARYLNRPFDYPGLGEVNQITHWTDVGALVGAPGDPQIVPRVPVWNDPGDGTLEERARGYLEINCAHCHSPTGRARFTGMYLEYDQPLNTQYGICKPPVAAGPGAGDLDFDIVPGDPSQSILSLRIASVQPGVEMPELSKSTVHTEGVALVNDFIASLAGGCGP